MSLDSNALFDALFALCLRAHESGALSREALVRTLPRVDGDFGAWSRQPWEIRFGELIDVFVAATEGLGGTTDHGVYDSTQKPSLGRDGAEVKTGMPGVETSEIVQFRAVESLLWLAVHFLAASPVSAEQKRAFLIRTLRKHFKESFDSALERDDDDPDEG